MMIFQAEECWPFLSNKSPNPVTSMSLSAEVNTGLLHKTSKIGELLDIHQERLALKAFYLASAGDSSVKNWDSEDPSEEIIELW